MINERTKNIIAYVVLASSILSIIGLFFVEIPEKNRDLINIALGTMLGWSSAVVNSHFGESLKAADKEKPQK